MSRVVFVIKYRLNLKKKASNLSYVLNIFLLKYYRKYYNNFFLNKKISKTCIGKTLKFSDKLDNVFV